MLLLCSAECLEQSGCRDPLKLQGTHGIIAANDRIPLSMGYVGVGEFNSRDNRGSATNTSMAGMCVSKIAGAINKAGNKVMPNEQSIVSAIFSNIQSLLTSPQCPGLGFCADLLDSEDSGAWPMTALA